MLIVRHGESLWDVGYRAAKSDPGIRDAPLSPNGHHQAVKVADKLARHELSRIITSPYRRALETADIVADRLKLAITIEPLVRERAVFSCDVGSPRSELAELWPHLNFDHLSEEWWCALKESEESMLERCAAFRAAMVATADWPNVVVIAHWAFIKGLTGKDTKNGEVVRFDPTGAPVKHSGALGGPASGA